MAQAVHDPGKVLLDLAWRSGWAAHPDPHRLCRRHPRVPELAHYTGTVVVLLGRDGNHRSVHQAVLLVPASAWTPTVEPDGELRDAAWVASLAGDVLKGWPPGIRLTARKERPYPGAQLRFTDAGGMRLTCFATNTTGSPIAHLELRLRRRARAEDRVRAARDTGLRNLPLHDTAQN